MLVVNNPNLLHDELKLHTRTTETDQDHRHTTEIEITQLQTEDLIQKTGINPPRTADHTRQTEIEKDPETIRQQEEIILKTEADLHQEADMKTTTSHPHHHQDLSQEAIQQEEEQNLYRIQVQKQSSSRSTVKNTFHSVRKTNNGLSLIFVEYPSIK